jgi:protein-disulfide isomerase
MRSVGASDHILGNPTAPIKIVTYSDFDCDYCKDFHTVMNRVIADRGADGRVAWVLRQFPLTEIHKNAFSHAEAAECVAKTAGTNAFFKFAQSLFDAQPASPSMYGSYAASAGAPAAAFTDCYTNAASQVDESIAADRQNALDMGAKGTPFSLLLVKGKPPIVMDGGYSYDAVLFLIDQQSVR